jgi:nucleoside-diphosphate-sugar epimerase
MAIVLPLKRKNRRMKKVIINGANGYVASNFIVELLQQDYHVIALARSNAKYSAEERMRVALNEMNDGENINFDKLSVYNYSLFENNFGLAETELKNILSGDVDYFHFAASLKFDTKSKEEIFGTNLEGLTNSIENFLKYTEAKSRFFFVSTAYSCGKISGTFYERFYENAEIDEFRNYYEQSKRYAENVIKKYMDEQNLNACILRLSQVVGNNENGVTKTDYGIFDFSRRIQSLANRYPNQTVRIKIDPDSTQNLIPIDTAVTYLMSAIEVEEVPTILNFISKTSIKNADLLASLGKLLPINLLYDNNLKREEMNSLERIVAVGMSFTGAYSDTNISFDTTNLDKIISKDISEVSPESIQQMLEYFLTGFNAKNPASDLKSAG